MLCHKESQAQYYTEYLYIHRSKNTGQVKKKKALSPTAAFISSAIDLSSPRPDQRKAEA